MSLVFPLICIMFCVAYYQETTDSNWPYILGFVMVVLYIIYLFKNPDLLKFFLLYL